MDVCFGDAGRFILSEIRHKKNLSPVLPNQPDSGDRRRGQRASSDRRQLEHTGGTCSLSFDPSEVVLRKETYHGDHIWVVSDELLSAMRHALICSDVRRWATYTGTLSSPTSGLLCIACNRR